MTYKFSKASAEKLEHAHPDLRKVAYRALELSKRDFGISETLRTIERQEQLVREGKSQTMNSRHLPDERGYSRALDFYAYVGKATYEPKYMRKIAGAFFQAAFELNIPIRWGGHFESLNDMPHIELARRF